MAKIRAKYKNFIVYGFWFCYDHAFYFLMDTKSTKKTGLNVVAQEEVSGYKTGPGK